MVPQKGKESKRIAESNLLYRCGMVEGRKKGEISGDEEEKSKRFCDIIMPWNPENENDKKEPTHRPPKCEETHPSRMNNHEHKRYII